jgi:hypothetical protein
MKKYINILKIKFKKILIFSGLLSVINICCGATPNTESIDNLVDWIAIWAGKVGLIVAFFGGIQVALALRNEDSDGKVRGIKTLVSGFMVYGITKSLDLFNF